MAWGGFGGTLGHGHGHGHGLGHHRPGGPGAENLPFAGIPSELQARVDALLRDEPEHHVGPVRFSQSGFDRRPFTLRRLLAAHRAALVGTFALVAVEAVAVQAGPLLTKIGIDDGIRAGSARTLLAVGVLYLASVGLGAAAGWARVAATGRVGERLLFDLRVRVFTHLQRLSMDFFTEEKTGRLLTRMTSDVDALAALFQDGLVQLAVQGLTMLIVTAVLVSLDVELAAVTLLAVVPTMLVLTLWFRARSDRAYGQVRERIAEVLAHLQESLAGVRVVAAHNRQRHNTVEHRNIVGEYRDANDRTAAVSAVYAPGSEVAGIAGQALILLVGGRMVLAGSLTVGELTAFVLYLASFFAPIQQLVQLYNTYQQGQAAVRKLRELLAVQPSVREHPGAVDLPQLRGEIELEGVTFGYDRARPVLRDVNLHVAAGETFALVGATGAGKSTVAKLVTRFHDPDAGRVLVDGHDLRAVTLASLRRQLGVVPQEPFLFAGSIRDNVAFARPEASDDEILEACRAVGIDDLVERLPHGIHTPCHERGVSLSSGERQLLALARAFLARPRVLILDEATSNLDMRSEAKIERALDVLLQGRTAIVIAHRLATAMRADRIAVIDDGRVVEVGPHAELVALGGRYAAMFAAWEASAGGNGRH